MNWPTWSPSLFITMKMAYLNSRRHYDKLPNNSVASAGYLLSSPPCSRTTSQPVAALDPNRPQINMFGLVRIFHFLGR